MSLICNDNFKWFLIRDNFLSPEECKEQIKIIDECQLKKVAIEDEELFLEILTYLESRAVKQSQETLKRERDKLKRKK